VVLLVVGLPVVILVLALALERLETMLLPSREADLPNEAGPRVHAAAVRGSAFTRPG
jgi:hypothetical protein